MKPQVLAFVFVLLFVSAEAKVGECTLCTILAGIIQQISLETNSPVSTVAPAFCYDITKDIPFLNGVCDILLDLYAGPLQTCVSSGISPDQCCHDMKLCSDTDTCTLFKTWPPATKIAERHHGDALLAAAKTGDSAKVVGQAARRNMIQSLFLSFHYFLRDRVGAAKQTGETDSILEAISAIVQQNHQKGEQNVQNTPVVDHLPLVDKDGDYYSTAPTLRGYHWRGKDCDDSKADVYPGRRLTNYPSSVDHNCNGIVGVNSNGQSYEDLFCSQTEQRGLINMGDSVTAHFRLPDQYLNPHLIKNGTYDDLLALIEDEADWPECSWGTGWAPAASCPKSPLNVDSLMLKLRARNLCNHRDYQNMGVNGARTGSYAPPTGIITTMHTRNVTDQPALVIFALVGNDVCNGHHDFSEMTTPAEFEANVLASMQYLDQRIAPGSYVVFVGLADGRVLFNTLQNETHPIGVPYPDFYDYLNCIGSSPCWGWMNTNATVRELTWTEHASLLNEVYPKIIAENRFNNFEMFYSPFNFTTVIDKWVAAGGHARDLIEPVDGFHPSQTGNVLFAQTLWDELQSTYPQCLGDVNPNNAQIQAMFGNQGGFDG